MLQEINKDAAATQRRQMYKHDKKMSIYSTGNSSSLIDYSGAATNQRTKWKML